MNKLVIEGIKDFNLEHIFQCGQCFRWTQNKDESFTGVAGGKVITLSIHGTTLTIENSSLDDFDSFWANYLDLETDYGKIKDNLVQSDERIAPAIATGYGIRILNQEIWETIASFIISANNNIPRISASIEKIAQRFGDFIATYNGQDYYAFPKPEKIANLSIDDLTACGLGYRARYLINTAKKFIELGNEYFDHLLSDEVSYKEAFDELIKLEGVGPKVANCILLFSLKKRAAFPIDTWMKKVMALIYEFDEEDIKGMAKFADEHFGEYAGIAQQYLFYYVRNNAN
ncbi:MAG: DNA glycosylase [Eubacteriales bacterium]|nr:DNA glycosylase [Eubacteriales bacterium]MDY3332358.1 DNA glycosylase [Gallibacter sp.]